MIRQDTPCIDVVERVTAYLDGALPEREEVEVELHLVTCPDCARYLEQMRKAIVLAGALPPEAVPAELEDALVAAFRAHRADGGAS